MAAADTSNDLHPHLARLEDLNEIFNLDLFSFKTYEEALTKSEKILARKWIQKLVQTPESVDFYIRRNEYIHLLLSQAQKHKLTPPFCQPPPGDSVLPPLSEAYSRALEAHEAEKVQPPKAGDPNLPLIYKLSPDVGKFLASQPVPRYGTFCYVTVVSEKTP